MSTHEMQEAGEAARVTHVTESFVRLETLDGSTLYSMARDRAYKGVTVGDECRVMGGGASAVKVSLRNVHETVLGLERRRRSTEVPDAVLRDVTIAHGMRLALRLLGMPEPTIPGSDVISEITLGAGGKVA